MFLEEGSVSRLVCNGNQFGADLAASKGTDYANWEAVLFHFLALL